MNRNVSTGHYWKCDTSDYYNYISFTGYYSTGLISKTTTEEAAVMWSLSIITEYLRNRRHRPLEKNDGGFKTSTCIWNERWSGADDEGHYGKFERHVSLHHVLVRLFSSTVMSKMALDVQGRVYSWTSCVFSESLSQSCCVKTRWCFTSPSVAFYWIDTKIWLKVLSMWFSDWYESVN